MQRKRNEYFLEVRPSAVNMPSLRYNCDILSYNCLRSRGLIAGYAVYVGDWAPIFPPSVDCYNSSDILY